MFTGIIQKTAPIVRVRQNKGNLDVRIARPRGWRTLKGQSIIVDGICSTVTAFGAGHFDITYMPETLKKTTARFWKRGHLVNLERSLTLRDFIDGHLVQGHVDAAGRVLTIQSIKSDHVVAIELPPALMRFVAPKGSITINGVSLTVVEKRKNNFTVALIPYTLAHTNWGEKKTGDKVNLECDMLGKYLYKYAAKEGTK